MYIYTNESVTKALEVALFSSDENKTQGEKALEYKAKLAKKLKVGVIAWACMGGQDGQIIEVKSNIK